MNTNMMSWFLELMTSLGLLPLTAEVSNPSELGGGYIS